MAGFVRVAPAPALVAGGGLAFAESALDHAELKIPNVALTPGRIPRQRHHPGLQSQHSVTTGATPPSASRTTTSPRAIEVTLAVASGTESRIGSPAAAMAVRHLERGILHSCAPTLSAPPWRRLPSRCPEVAAPAHIDVMRRAVAAPRDSPASLRVIWKHPPGQYRVVLGRTPPSGCGSSQAASRPVGAMETLTKQFESRVDVSLDRTGMKNIHARSASGGRSRSWCVSSVLADHRDWRWPARSPCSSKPAAGPMWPLFPPGATRPGILHRTERRQTDDQSNGTGHGRARAQFLFGKNALFGRRISQKEQAQDAHDQESDVLRPPKREAGFLRRQRGD